MVGMLRKDFASDEEFWVYNWLMEAKGKGLVVDITYQPGPFELSPRASVTVKKQLKTKVKDVDMFLFNPHVYTPDFSFTVSAELSGYFKLPLINNVIIDVKGHFNKHGDPKQFAINRKWMLIKFGIYVEKIVPEKLFKKTWVPDCCRFTPVRGDLVKRYIGYPGINEFIGGL